MPVKYRGNVWFTGWRKPISISGAGKVVGGILRRRPCFFSQLNPRRRPRFTPLLQSSQAGELPQEGGRGRLEPDADLVQEIQSARLTGTSARRDDIAPAYPKRSPLRRGLEVCSTSQSIHTNAIPKPTTTPRKSNVRPGAVSMVSIPYAMQAAYQLMTSGRQPRRRIHRGRPDLSRHPAPQLYLNGADTLRLPGINRRPEPRSRR